MVANPALINLQVQQSDPLPATIASGTNLLIPPENIQDRLRHFPEEVYDLSDESSLVRFMKVLLGDAGAGQLRKRLMMSRFQQVLQGTHFYDLDRFYGALFGFHRRIDEQLDINPYTDMATSDVWAQQHAKDASYRSRIIQFARALTYGATPTGMELMAEAVLSVDCDIFESFTQADTGSRTYAEIEAAYGTYGDMEGVSYGVLEGLGMSSPDDQDRRVFTVAPKRVITLAEAHDVMRVLNRLKPADSRFEIDSLGVPVHSPLDIRNVYSDSEYWEVIQKVAVTSGLAVNPYLDQSPTPVEQPRPPFTAYQGEGWSYVGDIIGVTASTILGSLVEALPTQSWRLNDGTYINFPARNAVMLRRSLLAGRAVSDAVLVSHPFVRGTDSLAQLFADRIPLKGLVTALSQFRYGESIPKRPTQRFWTTPPRAQTDTTKEVLEITFATERVINFFSFDMVRYPQTLSVEVFDSHNNVWVQAFSQSISDSFPRRFARVNLFNGHPEHWMPAHWIKVRRYISSFTTSRVRFVMTRSAGQPPLDPVTGLAAPYSLALRNINVGYRVNDVTQLPPSGIQTPSTDILGSPVQHEGSKIVASRLALNPPKYWKSEPQPVNFAVVNLYLDVRDSVGDAQVVDRFFVNPTHPGASLHLYYSNDSGDPADATFFDQVNWVPVSRDYTLQKGFIHLPPTKAKFFKFEFTNLVAEPHESFAAITRTVRLFPPDIVASSGQSFGTAQGAYPAGLGAAIGVTSPSYTDALRVLQAVGTQGYHPTEALYSTNLDGYANSQNLSWVFGFMPWHQESSVPRFTKAGRHNYMKVEFRHATKVGFFVGLQDLRAYRVNYVQDDDADVYFDHYDDTVNLQPGYTMTFSPNALSTGTAPGPIAVSKTFTSLHNVSRVQFATQQSDAVQLIPDDDFKDPSLSTYGWDDPSRWTKYGDASLLYRMAENSVLVKRFSVPPPVVIARTGGLIQDPIQPVFEERSMTVGDEEAAAATYGGIASPPVDAPSEGYVHAAVRVTIDTPLSSPLLLQIVAVSNGTVLAELPITGQPGEMVERWISYKIGEFSNPPAPTVTYLFRSGLIRPTIHDVFAGEDPATLGPPPVVPPPTDDSVVQVRLIQQGKSDDMWRIDALSLFDEGLVWEFSVNGGGEWYDATVIRNNDTGILTFPVPGTGLTYRVKGTRPNMSVSAIRIRPVYLGRRNARTDGTHRGPNVSVYDQEPPIQDDPMFTSWKPPIPRSWFYVARRYPVLPV